MSGFCQKCGTKLKDDDKFCPNCGKKIGSKTQKQVDYLDLIMDIVYINDNGRYRLSKAKMGGVLIFALIFFYMVFTSADYMMRNILVFLINISINFIAGLFWYGVCCGAGYLIRNYAIK